MKQSSKVAPKSTAAAEAISLEQMLATPEQHRDIQSTILRQRVRNSLQQVVEEELTIMLEGLRQETTAEGQQRFVRNGYHKQREVATVLGILPVRVPRLRDRTGQEHFRSVIVPPYLRRSTSVAEWLPFLYLQGISTGDFGDTLSQLMGRRVEISATTITRLKTMWRQERQEWLQRDLSGKKYVYWWADGINYNVRLLGEKRCLLVIIGATVTGKKELVGLYIGHRESALSWKEVLHQLQRQGLQHGPQLAIGDGALGFWSALQEVFPDTREQRCWVHKTANVLDKLPKRVQPDAKKHLHEIFNSLTRKDADASMRSFQKIFGDRYPKAVECLLKNQKQLLAFYDFPAAHWRHIRSTNVIESTFGGVRLRTYKTKGAGSEVAAELMVFKLILEAEKRWHKLNKASFLKLVLQREKFVNGERVKLVPAAATTQQPKKNVQRKAA